MPPQDLLKDIYRLTRENNEMLHAQRRHAFIGGFFKFLLYIVFFAAPIWFYMTYVSGTMDKLVNELNAIQGTAQQTQTQFNGFETLVNDVKSRFPAFLQGVPPTAATSTGNSQ